MWYEEEEKRAESGALQHNCGEAVRVEYLSLPRFLERVPRQVGEKREKTEDIYNVLYITL